MTGDDCCDIGQRISQTLGQQSCAGTGDRAIYGLQQRAFAAAGKGLHQFQIGPCRRINIKHRGRVTALGSCEWRTFTDLGLVHIRDGGVRCGQFNPAERAKSVQRRHAVKLLNVLGSTR